MIASLTASPSSQGPKSSLAGPAAMPWRRSPSQGAPSGRPDWSQNVYLRANCRILGPPAPLLAPPTELALEVISPNVPGLDIVTPGLPRRRLLVTLNASARNSTV